jgi:hypothetical protein
MIALRHFLLAPTLATFAASLAIAAPLSTEQAGAQVAAETEAADKEIRRVSPDGRFSIDISEKLHPQGDEFADFFTLELKSASGTLASYPTSGYLTEVHWSPGSDFVAINNRRGNSGDYLWILSLKDGSALKRPDDRFEEELREVVQAAVRKQEPRATEENLRKYWLVASGWRGPHVLDIAFRAKYEGDVGAFDYDTQVTVGERLTLSPAQPKRLAE